MIQMSDSAFKQMFHVGSRWQVESSKSALACGPRTVLQYDIFLVCWEWENGMITWMPIPEHADTLEFRDGYLKCAYPGDETSTLTFTRLEDLYDRATPIFRKLA